MNAYQLLMIFALSENCLTKALALLEDTTYFEDYLIQLLAKYTSNLIETKRKISHMLNKLENNNSVTRPDVFLLQQELATCAELEAELCEYISMSIH